MPNIPIQYEDVPRSVLRKELLDQAMLASRAGAPMNALAVLGIMAIHWGEQQDVLAPAWVVAMLALTALRIVALVADTRRTFDLRTRENLLITPLIGTSLGWIALPFYMLPGTGFLGQVGAVCVMSGLAAGATATLAPLKWPARFYIASTLAPGALLMLDVPGYGQVLCLLGFCFLTVMLFVHHRLHRSAVASLVQSYENRRLSAEADRSRKEVERLNDALLASQARLQQHNAELTSTVAERTRSMQLAYAVVENTGEGVMVLDRNGIAIQVNPAFSRITGYSFDEFVGQSSRLLRSDRHDKDFYDKAWEVLRRNGTWTGEVWSRHKDGSHFLERRSVNLIRDERGRLSHIVSVFNDITDSHTKDEQLRHLAFHDPLTGLGNRALLQDRLEMGIAQARRQGSRLAVLYLDLDQFKAVNDSLGHPVGDRLLQQVSERLKRCLRASDTLARIGGDEFVVLMNDVADGHDCSLLASKLTDAIARPLDLDASRIHVRTSIGIALFPDDGEDAKGLMKCADMAMYAAKAAGRNTCRFFQRALSERAEQRMQMEMALREAIEQGQFQLHYQAKVAADDTVQGYEALLRWCHPTWGNVPPDRFIPVAEDAGLIVAIGEWVVAQTCAQLARWHRAGHGWKNVAINVSAHQLENDDLGALILRETQRHGVPCSALEIEVTESVVVAQPEKTLPLLRGLREMGLTIAIDDFGTGHSSLAYLRRLPVDVLKIDRAFVQDMDGDEDAHAIVRTILGLSRTLALRTVAEGVETEQQALLLKEAGCDLLQGYLFARPEPAAAVEATWLSTRSI